MVLRGTRPWRRVGAIVISAAVICVVFGLLPIAASAARHYEKVSPADKALGDIVGDGATTVASRFGDAVAFNSRAPFGDTVGSGTIGQTQYVARRTDAAWVTHAITPTPRPDAKQTFFGPTLLQIYSDDLRTAVVRAYDLPDVTGDMPLRNNIYVEDTTTQTLETVTVSQVDLPLWFEFLDYPQFFWGISADARHVAFVAVTQFLPEAAQFAPNVYQWDDGVLSLAGILPDGTVPPGGSDTPTNLRGAMSPDGSRLLFTASTGGNSQLYMRIGGVRTVWISETELDPSDPNYQPDPTSVRAMAMTPDGRSVFFTTDTPLLPEDTNSGTDLYRYTDSVAPSSERNLTLVSHDGDMLDAQLIGASDDGTRVYYETTADRLIVWDHGRSRVISGSVPITGNVNEVLGLTGSIPGYGRVTADGEYMAFGIGSNFDTDLLGNVTHGHREMYLYSLRDDILRCVSCPSGPASGDATVLPAATSGPPVGNGGFRPRFLSDRGHVFFSSPEGLVPEDTNGVLDTYEYDPTTGRVSLLTTGTGKDPSTFADASASGDDVFIVTRQRLVSSDHDDLVDLYDVRSGSYLPAVVEPPTQPECEGDGCKPPPSASNPEDPRGSSVFEADGGHSAASTLLAVRHRIVLRGATGVLLVKLFAPGKLTWSGRGLQAGSIKRSRSGTYKVRLRLRTHAGTQLRASGVYATSVHLRFVSARGDETKRATRVTFRVAARKGR